MNKTVKQYAMLIGLLFAFGAKAQVGIGTNAPDASAQLEVLSTSKGLLIPRLSLVQREGINNPANGLLIYQTNNLPGFYYFNNGQWQRLVNGSELSSGGSGTIGNTILSGTTVPSPIVGTNGDFYLHLGNNSLYGPKTAGAWPNNGILLVGPKGEAGAKGDSGLKGDRGDNGLKGDKGDSGSKGDKGDSGLKGDRGDGGLKGDRGDNGLKGDRGEAGLKGDKGDPGIPGNSLPGTGKTVTSSGTIAIGNGKDAVLTDLTLDLADHAVTSIKIADGSIANVDLDKKNIPLSGFGAAAKNVSLGGFRITNLSDPTNNQDAATKKYVDDKLVAGGLLPMLSFDNGYNLSIKGSNTVSLADLNQSLSLEGTVLSISGPRNSRVDLSGLVGNGGGTGGSGGTGTVKSVAVTSANGITGSVTNPSTIPTITLGTSITAPVLKGEAGAIAAASTTGSGGTVVLSDGPTLKDPIINGVIKGNLDGTATNVTGVVGIANGGTGATTVAGAIANLGLDKFLLGNAPITGDTKTKITYDAKGFVTKGEDASTADIKESIDKKYVTDAQLAVLKNTTNINTGDQVASTVPVTPKGGIAANNVQAALEELQTKITTAAGGGMTAVKHDGTLTGDGNVTDLSIADNAITASKIKDGSVTDAKIETVSGTKVTGNITGNAANVTGIVPVLNGGTGADNAADAKVNLGLENVNNVSDLNKPISTLAQAALDTKEDKTNKSTNVVTDATSDIKYPTVKALKTYVDAKGAIVDATTTVKGQLMLSNDLGGTAEAPQVLNVGGATAADIKKGVDLANAATAANLAGTIVKRDPSGNITVGSVTGNLVGNATTATSITGVVMVPNGGTGIVSYTPGNYINALDATTLQQRTPDQIKAELGVDAKEDVVNKTTDGTLASNSDEKYPSEKATRTYVEAKVNAAVIGAGGVPNATAALLGKVQLAGDLAGIAEAPTVPGLLLKEPLITVLPVTKGGTGLAAYTPDGILVAESATKLKQINKTQLKEDLGLDQVSNVADKDKIISDATRSALDDKISKSEKAISGGVATLGADGKIPSSQIPAISFSSVTVVTSQAEMLALTGAQVGSTVINTAASKSFVLAATPANDVSNWKEILTPGSGVQSVNTKTGNVTLTAADLGLGNVNNTTDASKPVSTATQTALDGKEFIANKSLNITTDASSDSKYPSVKAVKTYVDALNSAGAPDATITAKGLVQLAGDLNGTAAAPKVAFVGAVTAAQVATGANAANAATTASTANTIVKRDGTGNIVGTLVGNASSATTISGTVGVANGGTGLNSYTAGNYIKATGTTTLGQVTPGAMKTELGIDLKEDLSNKSINLTADGASDSKYPSAKAVKTYVDAQASGGVGATSTTRGVIKLAGDLAHASSTADAPLVATVGGATAANIKLGVDLANAATTANTGNTIVKRDASGSFNATTATSAGKLTTARSINGIPFDGSQDITITAAAVATNLTYTPALADGALKSSTGNTVTLPGASGSAAGLMPAIDKAKLDKISDIATTADAGKVLTANAQGKATWVTPTGGGGAAYTLPAATSAALGGVKTGAGITIDADGVISTKTDLNYTASASNGVINSSTSNVTAVIPASSSSDAGLMLPGEKNKLTNYPLITASDKDKVLTVNAAGTAATWATPATGGGTGGGGTMPKIYIPQGGSYAMVKSVGTGEVTLTQKDGPVSGLKNLFTVTIPDGVILQTIRFTIDNVLLGKNPSDPPPVIIIEIKDLSGKVNNSLDDLWAPASHIAIDRTSGQFPSPFKTAGAPSSAILMTLESVSGGVISLKYAGQSQKSYMFILGF